MLREYYHTDASRSSTSYFVTEALSAFKLKYVRRRISGDDYIKYVKEFIRLVLGANPGIDEVNILDPVVRREAERVRFINWDLTQRDLSKRHPDLKGYVRFFRNDDDPPDSTHCGHESVGEFADLLRFITKVMLQIPPTAGA